MEKFKKDFGANPEAVKKIVKKVKHLMATHKNEKTDPDKVMKAIIDEMVGESVNMDDHKEIIAKIKGIVAKVKSGEIDKEMYKI